MTKTCPHCNGTNISEIVYGLPAPEFLLKPKDKKKNVVHGGCVSPYFHGIVRIFKRVAAAVAST